MEKRNLDGFSAPDPHEFERAVWRKRRERYTIRISHAHYLVARDDVA
jgi:hypothetical protein